MDAATKDRVTGRLNSTEGHVGGVQRMVEEDACCIDAIRQVIAVRRALEKVNGIVLQDHFETCVSTAIRANALRKESGSSGRCWMSLRPRTTFGLSRRTPRCPRGSLGVFVRRGSIQSLTNSKSTESKEKQTR